MKLFGYPQEGSSASDAGPARMDEVTILANPDELRRIAAFLLAASDSMQRMGDSYNHEHLSDHQRGFGDSPQLIVANSPAADR